jgi:hypothetical protein
MVLVPQVVDAAGDVPVLAAGGIADGRGIAAALALGAQGVVLGTRFLAGAEMGIDQSWKDRIVTADATDAVKVPNGERVLPPFTFELPQGKPPAPRALQTPLTDRLESDPGSVDPATVVPSLVAAIRAGGGHDQLPFTGQSAALVDDVLRRRRSSPASWPRLVWRWMRHSGPRRTAIEVSREIDVDPLLAGERRSRALDVAIEVWAASRPLCVAHNSERAKFVAARQ